MPFSSRQQQAWAFGTGQPWAKRWADETDFSKLPKRVKRIRSRRLKGCTCDDVTKESLGPGITRIRGNLCNVHGKYGPCDAALSGKKPKGGKGRTAKPKTPKKTEQQRAAEQAGKRTERGVARATEHAQNRERVLRSLNIAPDGGSALGDLADGAQPDADAVKRGGFVEAGLVEQANDGSYRLTSSGRAMLTAAAAGDVGKAGDIISGARDRTTARGERIRAATERKRQAEQRRQAVEARRQARAAKRGQRTTTKAAGSPGDYLVVEDRTKPSTWHLQVRTNGKPDHRLMGGAYAALTVGYRGNKYAGPQKAEALAKLRALYASEKMSIPESKESSFTVYKDASGADRWLSVSSTAYRDRDQEIVSTKALNGAVALADASGYRGPLRFWHVPGVELGDCDYQGTAQDGRFLIESGTFRSPALAAAVKARADKYQISIGFTHPANEPDSQGVFHHIALFERSLVPKGRAANLFTQVQLATKEQRMLSTEKQAELEQLLGGDQTLLSTLLGNIATTDKAAQSSGVSFKDTDIRAIIREELFALLSPATKEAETEKAAPMIEGSPEEEAAEPPEEAMAEGDTDMGDDNMLNPAEIAAIAQAVVQAIGPALNIEAKMAGHLNEMKGLIGGMSTQKDAAIAETKAELEQVKAQVADLSGSQPRILSGGYRASQAAATITTDDKKLKEAQPSADPVVQSFGAFMTDLGFGQPTQPGA